MKKKPQIPVSIDHICLISILNLMESYNKIRIYIMTLLTLVLATVQVKSLIYPEKINVVYLK